MNNDEKIYLRVLADLPFMLEILINSEQQADTFASEMLRERILREREAVRLEEDRLHRQTQEMIQQHELDRETKADD